MLIEFKLSNFRSVRDSQTLSMVAGAGKELPQNVCSSDSDQDLQLVRSAAIYGPNAGGKSNLIRALDFMRKFILLSAKESQQGEKIPVKSFLFDEKIREQPSTFEVTFSKEKVRYQYGFALDKDCVTEEWLFAYPSGRVQQWFTRKYDKTTGKSQWKFSKFFTGKKQVWKEATRNNSLFLSTAVQLNNEQLVPVFNWFQQDLIVLSPRSGTINSSNSNINKIITLLETDEGKQSVMPYLNVADPSVSDVSFKFEEIFGSDVMVSPSKLDKDRKLTKMSTGFITPKIYLVHGNVELDAHQESGGTQKFLWLAAYWIDALSKGKVIIVDELNDRLHPLAMKFLISQICHPEINKKNAQLIFSTHDTALLDSKLFRRDQVWFVEKDKNNSTQLYSLLSFSPRKDEALAKGYLQGRYGALPYIGDWSF